VTVLIAEIDSNRHRCGSREIASSPPPPHSRGSHRPNSQANTMACTTFASTKNPASTAEAPVIMLTATVAATSSANSRERRCATNHTAATPAAGQTGSGWCDP
jgi:hypothetical protein